MTKFGIDFGIKKDIVFGIAKHLVSKKYCFRFGIKNFVSKKYQILYKKFGIGKSFTKPLPRGWVSIL